MKRVMLRAPFVLLVACSLATAALADPLRDAQAAYKAM